jgi:hypothetical protein
MFLLHATIFRRMHTYYHFCIHEDGHVRPKHVVEEYTQDRYVNKNFAFRTMMTLIYRILVVMQQDAEIHYE